MSTRAFPDGITPYQAFTGNAPSLAHLRIFGCKAWVHIPNKKRRKLDPKSLECTFLGYAKNRKAFVVAHHSSNRVFESRDVRFDEGLGSHPNRVEIEIEIDQPESSVPEVTPKNELHTLTLSASDAKLSDTSKSSSEISDVIPSFLKEKSIVSPPSLSSQPYPHPAPPPDLRRST